MKYYFSDFSLDTEIKELYHRSEAVDLTKKSYILLTYLLENNHKIHTKEELVEHVWQGRIVSDNTIDQSISKLRKTLNDHQPNNYIEVIYGQGVKFIPEVSQHKIIKKTNQQIGVMAVISMVLVMVMGWYFFQKPVSKPMKPQVLIVPPEIDDSWVQSGSDQLLTQMLNFSGVADVVDFNEKPKFVNDAQFIENQQQQKPGLQTIQSMLENNEGQYQLSLSVSNANKDFSQTFSGQDLSQLMSESMTWIGEKIAPNNELQGQSEWLPASDHVAELYLRAMHSLKNNDFEKSRKQLDVVIEEAPHFYMAKYQLAHVYSIQNKHDESLAILNTLLQLPTNDPIAIASTSLKAYILDTLGQYDQAIALYEDLFSLYDNNQFIPLLRARFDYATVLIHANQADLANTQLDLISAQLAESDSITLLADVKVLKGSLAQQQGDVEVAQTQLSEALDLFERNDDALGTARTYSALARISNQEANYTLAESYLDESLAITRAVGFKLGEGATLNELAYVMMVQGQLTKAKKLVQNMHQIAIEIEYPAMQIAAKQLLFDMAREQQDWMEAERHLAQHLQIATETNNGRALLKNQMLELSLRTDTGQIGATADLIVNLQQHIDQQNEVRMQPRLDWYKARIYWQQKQTEMAIELLLSAKSQAQSNEDGETLININNSLAEIHLFENDPEQALSVLNESAKFRPFALPYLKLKAQSQAALGQTLKAIETMNLCKQQAADRWSNKEDSYLKSLVASVQSTSSPGVN